MDGAYNELSLELYALGNVMWRRLGEHMRKAELSDVTPMHATIIAYLEEHGETFQRDLENEFQVNRSTITKIVQVMERKGYIRREEVPQDKRLKRLVLTEVGRGLYDRLRQCGEATNQDMMDALTVEERAALVAALQKIRKKLE